MNLFCREPDRQRTSLYWELPNGCTVNIDRSRSKGGSDLWSLSHICASGDDGRIISGCLFSEDFPLPTDFTREPHVVIDRWLAWAEANGPWIEANASDGYDDVEEYQDVPLPSVAHYLA